MHCRLPAVVLQRAQVPQLNESDSAVRLVDTVLVLHPPVAGQSDVLGRLGAVGRGTPLHGPDRPPRTQQHVPAVRVGGLRREPGKQGGVKKGEEIKVLL